MIRRTLVVGSLMLLGAAGSSCSGAEGEAEAGPLESAAPAEAVLLPVSNGGEGPRVPDDRIELPDGSVPEGRALEAALVYRRYVQALDEAPADPASAASVATGTALEMLTSSADTRLGTSATTVGVTNIAEAGEVVSLETCDVVDLGENDVDPDVDRIRDFRSNRVTVTFAGGDGDQPVVSEVVRMSSSLSQGLFCASPEVQREMVAAAFGGVEAFEREVGALDGDAGVLEDHFVEPALSRLAPTIEKASDTTATGEVTLGGVEVQAFVPGAVANVGLCLVYPDGFVVTQPDGGSAVEHAPGARVPVVASLFDTRDDGWMVNDLTTERATSACES